MEKSIITLTPAGVSMDALLSALNMGGDSDLLADVAALHRAAMDIARPIALYAPYVPDTAGHVIRINGITLEQPFVYTMLSERPLVIPYVASCGQEIEQWSRSLTDPFEQFAADTLKQLCLFFIREKLFEEVRETYFDAGKNISTINPGSLAEWPITGQIPLFEMLGDVTGDIGVSLSDSLLMLPTKSVSGILFQTDEPYHNCQLCPRTDCPNRRVAYAGTM